MQSCLHEAIRLRAAGTVAGNKQRHRAITSLGLAVVVGVRYVTARDYYGVLFFSLFDRGVIRLLSARGTN
jgi:hypothetical protein